ncbi:MAG: tetratricopeptide repeat protein [Chloroflexi bacterium]|nr:tetratricopeptide repeat protein [Chloroflexota bacterium]
MSLDNLPIPLTRFIGREKEIAEVIRLSEQTRLLTLTGSGGCGKTRLALEVATRLADSFEHGVALVEFAPLNDPALVPQAVAHVLDVRESANQSLSQSLANFLRPQQFLLVLDNCEHLIMESAHLVEELLQACPRLSILATSREALNVAGETTWRIPPLQIPDPMTTTTPETLLTSDSACLFVDRASSIEQTFAATSDNANAIAQICFRLDGMPLAIELAATRVKTLSVEQIAARLDDRFRLLTTGNRTAPTRQQTLRATMDWSYALLSDEERITLNRLSVFAGGWTPEAAEAICADVSDVLDLLSRLVDKSLVIAETRDGATRYRMLETIRQYAWEKLNETGKVEGTYNRHLDFFLHLAEEAEPNLVGPDPLKWLRRLDSEYGNLRLALRAAVEFKATDKGLCLVCALGQFWEARGYFSEGRALATLFLASSAEMDPSTKLICAQVLFHVGWLAVLQNDYVTGDSLLQESIALCQELGDDTGAARALVPLSFAALNHGNSALANSLIDKALALLTPQGEKHTLAQALNIRGIVLREQGDYASARASMDESLALRRALEDKRAIATSLNDIGATAFAQGDPGAEAMLETSLKMRQELDEQFGIPRCLHDLGAVALNQGDLVRAHTHYSEGLAIFRDQGDKRNAIKCLEGLAGVAAASSQFVNAAILLGAAEVARERIGVPLPKTWRANYERALSIIQQQLDNTILASTWSEGRALSLGQAIEYALTEIKIPDAPDAPASALSPRQAAKEKFGGLTVREREVAALIAQGKSNREMAETFVLSERTIEGYVGNILNKLGFSARTQIAAWAAQKGLLRRDEKPD